MRGIVTDEKGAYVKAAIVRLIIAKDSDDESGAVAVTYAETDEEGKFVIQELNPDEKYIIEVLVESADSGVDAKAAEAGLESEAAEVSYIIDSLMINNMIEETVRENIPVDHLYSSMGFHLKDKPYLTRNNLW